MIASRKFALGFAGLAFSTLGLSACSTADFSSVLTHIVESKYQFPVAQMITSETNGRLGGGDFYVGAKSYQNVQLVDDIDSTSYSVSPAIDSSFDTTGAINLGLLDRLDVFYNDGIGAKVQVYGDSAIEAKDGYSVAIAYTALAVAHTDKSSDDTGSVKTAKSTVRGSGQRWNVIVGKRMQPDMLWYGSVFYSHAHVSNVHLYQTNNTSFTQENDVNSGSGNSAGANMGIQMTNKDKVFKVFTVNYGYEVAYTSSHWKKTFASVEKTDENGFGLGARLGLMW
jgi:hypothetical protein